MPKELVYQCPWPDCKHPSREILPGEGVKVGKRWFHTDCAHQKQGMIAIRDYYYENINKMVVMKLLVHTIKNVVLVKGIDPDYVLFTLKYAVKNNIPCKSPLSMHYFVGSPRFQDAWERYKRKGPSVKTRQERIEEAKKKRQERIVAADTEQFTFKPASPKSFADVLKK